MPKKQTPEKQRRYPWGGERPSVVERRWQLILDQLPARRQQFLEENQKAVDAAIAEFDREEEEAKKNLDTLANYRKAIRSKKRTSSVRLTRLLGAHLGVSTEEAKAVLARMEAEKADGKVHPSRAKPISTRRKGVQQKQTSAQHA